mgnify:CR=1 FL=1
MAVFDTLGISGSGLLAHRKWLDAVSDTARAEFGGDPEGRIVYEPDHPMANADGYVRYPDIDLGDQMVQLLMAQRGYQANLAVVERATSAYQAALQLGKG